MIQLNRMIIILIMLVSFLVVFSIIPFWIQRAKRFGFLDLLLSAIGSTIGAGVFILLPIGINTAGFGVIFPLILGSVITIIVVFNYGELAAALPFTMGRVFLFPTLSASTSENSFNRSRL